MIYLFLSKDLLTKYYHKCKKQPVNDIKVFLKKKKGKRDNMVVNITKISQKMENKSLLSAEKNIIK